MKKTTREWVKKAEDDYTLARQASRSIIPLHDGVYFHCQQCAEKYLKGLMEELGLAVPKTHDLDVLLTALVPTTRRGGRCVADYFFFPILLWKRATPVRMPASGRRSPPYAGPLVCALRARALLGIRKRPDCPGRGDFGSPLYRRTYKKSTSPKKLSRREISASNRPPRVM
jgi:hypothetical protein